MTFRLSKLVLPIIAGALLLTPAYAVNVTYSTTGTFGAGTNSTPGTSTYTDGSGVTIAFTKVLTSTVGPLFPTLVNFGSFTPSALTGTDTINTTFTLTVSQTLPTPAGPETLSDTFSGQIETGASNVTLVFTSASPGAVLTTAPLSGAPAYQFTLGGVEYWVNKTTGIAPSTSLAGLSVIPGAIDALPEPAFYGLTGTGFFGLLFMAIRRRRQVQAS